MSQDNETKSEFSPISDSLWTDITKVDEKYTRAYTKGDFTGTSIHHVHGRKVMTKKFGPHGLGWGFKTRNWEDDGTTVTCLGRLWYRPHYLDKSYPWDLVCEVFEIGSIGKLIENGNGTMKPTTDIKKGAATDAFNRCCMALGHGAEIYAGLVAPPDPKGNPQGQPNGAGNPDAINGNMTPANGTPNGGSHNPPGSGVANGNQPSHIGNGTNGNPPAGKQSAGQEGSKGPVNGTGKPDAGNEKGPASTGTTSSGPAPSSATATGNGNQSDGNSDGTGSTQPDQVEVQKLVEQLKIEHPILKKCESGVQNGILWFKIKTPNPGKQLKALTDFGFQPYGNGHHYWGVNVTAGKTAA